MRVLYVSDTYAPQVNGVTTVLRQMVEALDTRGHEIAMVCPEYPTSWRGPPSACLRIPSVAFPPYPAIRLAVPAKRRIAEFMDRFRPDIVHVATEGPLGFAGRTVAVR